MKNENTISMIHFRIVKATGIAIPKRLTRFYIITEIYITKRSLRLMKMNMAIKKKKVWSLMKSYVEEENGNQTDYKDFVIEIK